jgi:hypothetical protein
MSTSPVFASRRSNAMRRPSCDHVGWRSVSSVPVMRSLLTVGASTVIVQMSAVPSIVLE